MTVLVEDDIRTAKPLRAELPLPVIGLLVVSVCAFFAGLSACPLLDPGDGYFAEAAREMLRRGDYVVPYLNGQIYFSKPIMIYWLIIASYKCFGVTELAARLPSAVMATASVIFTFAIGRRIHGVSAGFLAGLVLASSPLFCTFGRMCLVDMTFSTFLTGALWATVGALTGQSRSSWIWLYVFLAGAVLTKGPAALILFAATMVLYGLWQRPGWQVFFSKLGLLPGIAILLALTLPWFYAVGAATDGLWPTVFLQFENVDRFHGQTNHVNHNPLFYLWVLAYGIFPWTMVVPSICASMLKQWPAGRAASLLLCWIVVVVGAFSVSATKLQTYVLPVCAPLAVLIGVELARWLALIDSGRFTRLPKTFALSSTVLAILGAGLFVLSMTLLAGLACGFYAFPPAPVTEPLKLATAIVTLACSAIALGQGWLYRRRAYAAWFKSFLLANCALVSLTAGVIFEIAYDYTQADLHEIIQPLTRLDWTDKDIAIFNHFKPSVMFYLHHSVDSFFQPDSLVPLAPGEHFSQYVLLTERNAPLLLPAYGNKLHVINRCGRWLLAESNELKLRKLPTLAATFKARSNLSVKGLHWGTLPFAGSGSSL